MSKQSLFLSNLGQMAFSAAICGIFFLFVSQLWLPKYHVVDLDALANAKALAVQRLILAGKIHPDEYEAQFDKFDSEVMDDIIDISGGRLVLQRGTVIYAGPNLIDITPEIARRKNLNLADTVDKLLQEQKSVQ